MALKVRLATVVGLLAGLAVAQKCATGVHMIVARASTENPGTGVIGQVANQVAQKIPGSDIVAVDYPATLQNYQDSEQQGVAAMQKLVQQYSAQCPQGKMVLMGYSQGAQVAADVLCGTSEQNFPQSQPMGSNITSKVAAVVLMGDPSHVPGAAFNQGTAKNAGVFPRSNVAGCKAVASKMASFCNSGDTFCDSGNSLQTHLGYVQSNGADAVQFIVQNAMGGAGAASNRTSQSGKITARTWAA